MPILLLTTALLLVGQGHDAEAIHRQLDSYLLDYEPRLSALVADETMTQRMQVNRFVTHRRIKSEVAFVSLPDPGGWLGFRRVVEVNGRQVLDRGEALAQLLTDGARDGFGQARQLLAASAAHNLGEPRTINLPNLPLELLHPRNRQRFAHEVFGREKVRGVNAVVLRLDEVTSPTIIQQPGAGDMKTVVWAWVEPGSGRLMRAQVTTRDIRIGMPGFDAVIRVDFGHESKLGLMVPIEMSETFYVNRGRPGTGVAKYSNYRQFATGARIVPQPLLHFSEGKR